MEKTIIIDGKEYTAIYNALTAKIYADQFRSDLLIDKDRMQNKLIYRIKNAKENENWMGVVHYILDLGGREFLQKITYACLRTYNEKHKKAFPTYDKFLESIDDYEQFMASSGDVYELIALGNKTIVEPEETEKEENKENKKGKKK